MKIENVEKKAMAWTIKSELVFLASIASGLAFLWFIGNYFS